MQASVNKSDVIWSYLGTAFSMLSNLITIPMVIYFLDSDLVGLWYIFVSIGAIANLFDFGFTVTLARNITYVWGGARHLFKLGVETVHNEEPDYGLMKGILDTSKRIYFIISIVVLALLATVGTAYIFYKSQELEGSLHLYAWGVYAIGTFLNLYYNYYDSFLRGVGAIDIANKNRVIARCLHLLLMLVLLLCGAGILGASIAYLVYGIVFRLLGKKRFYEYKGIGENLRAVKKETSKEESSNLFKVVWYNAWRDGLIQFSQYCCEQFSVLICSFYLSLAQTGIYSIAVQISVAIATLSSVLYATYQPSLQTAYVNNDTPKIRESLSIILFVFCISFFVGSVLAVVLGIPVLRWIKPETVVSVPVLLGCCLNQFILKYRNCYTSYFSCTNRLIYMPAFVISAIGCVILSFVFMGPFKWGVWGLLLAQVISQVVYNFWYWPHKAKAELSINSISMLKMAARFFVDKFIYGKR